MHKKLTPLAADYTDAEILAAAYKVIVIGPEDAIPDDEELMLLIAEQTIIDKHGPLEPRNE